MAQPVTDETLVPFVGRLQEERNIWLCTVRADGRPHLVPIWFVWHERRVWVCTYAGSQKVRNLETRRDVSVALESGSAPCVIEGTAVLHPIETVWDALNPPFIRKYDWDLKADPDSLIMIEVMPLRLLY
ncbi:MAG: pyridoxamine 5'-phosphate oxidase family protein [Anaerolineae bacterium]|nr:pyridoxamine 5'-phosphate oxidase family protein [Anaerolineae bacterium]